MKETDLQVLRIEPGEAPEPVTMPNTLQAFQKAVGGYIELLYLEDGICLVCNEEGKLIGLSANRHVAGDTIAGAFLIVGEADGEFCSLSQEDAAYYAEQFAEPIQSCGESTQWEFYVM